jgi:hypothetical protein
MSEPRTEAGRRLLRGVVNLRHRDNVDAAYECESGVDRCHDCVEDRDAVKAIEAEAATPDPRVERLEAALREAYTLIVSAEPTLIRDARDGPSEVSLHYKAMLRDKVGEWLAPYRDDFDMGLRALLRSPQERSGGNPYETVSQERSGE